jgi:hypothetical protein
VYVEPTTSKFLHLFRVDRLGIVPGLNGMSGGPAFYVRGNEWLFAGVVVRGGGPANLALFVDGRLLRWMIRDRRKRAADG